MILAMIFPREILNGTGELNCKKCPVIIDKQAQMAAKCIVFFNFL